MSELHAVATIPAQPESADGVRAALQTLVTATREEEGCLGFDLFESAATAGTFVIIERWRSQQDLDAHMGTPHVAAALAAVDGHLAGEVAVDPLVPVD